MAFLFATSFYLFTILFYSISHSLPIGKPGGLSAGWSYETHAGFEGLKAPAPSLDEICNKFRFGLSHKVICLLCKGLHPWCFLPTTTTQPITTTTPTTTISTTTTSTTSTTSTTPTTPTTPTTTTTTIIEPLAEK